MQQSLQFCLLFHIFFICSSSPNQHTPGEDLLVVIYLFNQYNILNAKVCAKCTTNSQTAAVCCCFIELLWMTGITGTDKNSMNQESRFTSDTTTLLAISFFSEPMFAILVLFLIDNPYISSL